MVLNLMKIYIYALLAILIFSFYAFAQLKTPASKNHVQATMTDEGVTSELFPMPLGMSPNLSDAKFGIKYFGTQSESDISFNLFLKGTRSRYSTQ